MFVTVIGGTSARFILLNAISGHSLMANLQFVTLPVTVAGPKSWNSLGVHQLRG